MKSSQKTREVTSTVSAAALLNLTFVRTKPLEIRERQDGTWSIWYPDPGFNPCDHNKECIKETLAGPKLIESSFSGSTLEAALDEAREMGSIGEPKVIHKETHSERMKRIWEERRRMKATV